jgi:hypothetical protein
MGKIGYISAGFCALFLGTLGIFVPLLPTTPLVLLAAFCFSRSNKRLEAWLEGNRVFGPFIVNYRTKQGISRLHKAGTLLFLWAGLVTSAWLVSSFFLYIVLAAVGAGVSVHILCIKTK